MKAAECAICGCDIGRHSVNNDGCECRYCAGFQLKAAPDPTFTSIAAALERIAAALEARNLANEGRREYEDRLAEIRERRGYYDGHRGRS